MRPHRLLLAAALLAAAALGACRCGRREPLPSATPLPPPARWLPAAAEGAVVVPDLGALGDRLRALEGLKVAGFAAQLQGFGTAQEWVGGFLGQVGLDLRSREALVAAGVDASRGAAAAWSPDGAVLAVAVQDAAKLEALLGKLARSRLGASAPVKSGALTTWSRADGAPVLGLLQVEGAGLVASGTAATRLEGWGRLPAEQSLARDAAFASACKRLGGTALAWARVPPGTRWGEPRAAEVPGMTAALRASADSLSVEVELDAVPAGWDAAALAAAGGAQPPFAALPRDAVAWAWYGGDPTRLKVLAETLLGERGRRALEAASVQLESGLLGSVHPGLAASLSVAPSIQFGAVPELDVRRTNPFRYVHVVGAARVKDAPAVERLLEVLPGVAPSFGARMERAQRAGRAVLLSSYSQGEGLHLAVHEGRVIAASPESRLLEALGGAGQAGTQAGTGMPAPAQQEAQRWPLAVVVDLHRLAAAVRALPGDAWGPGGSFVKAGWVRWLDGTDDLSWVLAGARAQEGRLQLHLSLGLGRP
jgi:hypothetical protein